MKNKKIFIWLAMAFMWMFSSCGAGPAEIASESKISTDVQSGATDVDVGKTYTITFAAPVNTSTVTTSTFFIVPSTASANIDEMWESILQDVSADLSACDSANAIAATVTCATQLSCTLTPSSSLSYNQMYRLCLTTGITFANPNTSGFFSGYTETYTTKKDTNANLSALTISSGTLAPTFDSSTVAYTDSVAYGTTSVTVTPTVAGTGATIKVNTVTVTSGSASDPISLSVGDNTISIVVTAQDGTTTKTYTITVTRAADTDATLSNLTISNGSLNPTFAAGTITYTATELNSVSSITLTPTAAGSTATITVDGSAVTSGSASQSIALTTDVAKAIAVVVTAGDATTTKTYTVTVTRLSAGATLSNLTISSGTLTPTFDSGTLTYTDSVANNVSSVTLTPTSTDSGSSITVDGSAVSSGQASQAISLTEGVAKAVDVVVTSEDATTTKTYTVTVTRTSIPTITSVYDGATELPTLVRQTGTAASAAIIATFSNQMDSDTIGNIDYTCNGSSVTYTAAGSSGDTVWTLTPSSDLVGYADCTITIGSDVKDVYGNAISGSDPLAATTFPTQCATLDRFLTNTLNFPTRTSETTPATVNGNCWTYFKGVGDTTNSNAQDFSVGSATMAYSSGTEDHTGSKIHYIYKTFTLPASAFTATVSLIGGTATNNDLFCGVTLRNSTNSNPTYQVYYNAQDDDSQECILSTSAGGMPAFVKVSCATGPAPSTPLFVQLSSDGASPNATISASYRSGSTGDYTPIGPSATKIAVGGTVNVGIFCTSKAVFSQNADGFVVTGATATGPNGAQY